MPHILCVHIHEKHTYIYYCNIYIYLYLSNYLFIYLSIYIYMTCQICRAFTRWSSSNLLIRAAALRSRFFSCQSQMARLSEGDLAPPYSMYGIKITQHSFESMQFSSISPGSLYGVNRLGRFFLSAHQWFRSLFWPLLGFQRSWFFFSTFHLRLSSYSPPRTWQHLPMVRLACTLIPRQQDGVHSFLAIYYIFKTQ